MRDHHHGLFRIIKHLKRVLQHVQDPLLNLLIDTAGQMRSRLHGRCVRESIEQKPAKPDPIHVRLAHAVLHDTFLVFLKDVLKIDLTPNNVLPTIVPDTISDFLLQPLIKISLRIAHPVNGNDCKFAHGLFLQVLQHLCHISPRR